MTAEEEVAQLKKELAAEREESARLEGELARERASFAKLYHASGVALILGILLASIGSALSFILPLQSLTPLWFVVTLTRSIGALLLLMGLMGLPGIFAREPPRASLLGLVGFILTFIGVFLYASYFFLTTLLFLPWLAQAAPKLAGACSVMGGCSFGNGLPVFFIFFLVAGILSVLGGILLGIAIILATMLPRGSGLLLLICAILSLVASFPFIIVPLVFVLLALALGWIGYTLINSRGEPA